MIGGFKKREHTNTVRIHQHPPVVDIFKRHQWKGSFERMRGNDVEVAREFTLSLIPLIRTYAIVVVKGISVVITLELISRITTLTLGYHGEKRIRVTTPLQIKDSFWKETSQWRIKMGLEGKEFHTLGRS